MRIKSKRGGGAALCVAPPSAMKIAASLAVCLAAWYGLMMDSGRQIVRDWRDSFRSVDIAAEEPVIELADAHEVREAPAEVAEVDIDFTPKAATWNGPAPEVFRQPRFADVKGAKVTVMFDSDVVEGYRCEVAAESGGRVAASYSLIAFAGREIAPKSVMVTLIWPSNDGDERTPVSVGE